MFYVQPKKRERKAKKSTRRTQNTQDHGGCGKETGLVKWTYLIAEQIFFHVFFFFFVFFRHKLSFRFTIWFQLSRRLLETNFNRLHARAKKLL